MSNAGTWIWENTSPKYDEYADFKETFHITCDTAPVRLRISSDSNYAVYVNGALAAFGQYADFPHCKVADTHDLSAYCHPGENTLLVTVWYYGAPFSTYHPGKAGLFYEVTSGSTIIAASGLHTLCRRNPHYVSHREKIISLQLGFSFSYDANGIDAPYHRAVSVDYAPTLNERPIPPLELWAQVPGTMIGGNGSTHFLLDLGQEEAGFLELSLESSAVQTIVIAYGEHLVDGHVLRQIGEKDFSVQYRTRLGENAYLNPFRRLGCRYLEVFAEQPISIHSIGIRPTMYPVTVLPFDAGSPRRQQIYDTAVRTLRLCMHEHYEDNPWREQSLYLLDGRNEMLCGYYAFGETRLSRACLWLVAQDRRKDGFLSICFPCGTDLVIPSFCLHWYLAVLEYTTFSGDLTLAAEIWDKLCSVLDAFLPFMDPKTGLLPRLSGETFWNFYEWSDPLMADYDGTVIQLNNPGTDLILNCLFLRSIDIMTQLSDMTGLPFGLSHLAAPLRQAIRDTFRAEDGLFYTDTAHTHISEFGCALAILSGVADRQDAERLCRLLTSAQRCQMVPTALGMTTFVYDALLQTDPDRYRQFILDDIDTRYGSMLDAGSTTFWETAEGWQDFSGAGCLCQGWSALAIYYYRKLL